MVSAQSMVPVKNPGQLLNAINAHECIYLRELAPELLLHPLHQTTGDNELRDPAGSAVAEIALDHLPGFGNGRLEKPAGVDDDNVGLFRDSAETEPGLAENPEDVLGVNQVLGTTKGNDRDGESLR
jgi:hypothetical protein